MSKTVAKIALIAGAAVLVVASGGALAPFIATAATAAGAGAAAATIGSIAATLLVTTALSSAAQLLGAGGGGGTPTSPAQLSRLNVSLVPGTPRIIAFGETAFATDLRASIPSGTDQAYHEYVLCVASHTVESITEIWFEDRQAWTLAGGVTAYYTGYLTTVTVRNPGTNANGIAINAQWTANSTLTGCAYVYLKIKRTGSSAKAESPLASGIPSRVTVIGKGMKVYDPRLDSTVTGGSGSHRAATQSTWEYSNGGIDRGNNPALQILTYLLGWQINSKLAVGKGLPASRLDLPSFIAAANICDELITLAAGGTQRRYEAHGLFSEADAPTAVMDALLTACNGRLTDANGKLGISLAYNDLSGTLYEFTDDDVLGAFEWNPTPSIQETSNVVRGRFTDPSANSLYQMVDYPAIRLTSPDGIDRVMTLDLPLVQEGRRAQRLAKQVLQRAQYQGTFGAIFGIRAWGVKVGDPVKLTFTALSFSQKLFRVVRQGIRSDGTVELILREEAAAIYAWATEESAVVTVAPPTVYDQLNNPLAVVQGVDIGVENGADVTATNAPDLTGNLAWAISGDVAGTVTSVLPETRRYSAFEGVTNVSTTTAFVLSGATPGVSATVNNTPADPNRGIVTLGTGTTGSGTVVLTATLPSGGVVARTITVTKTNASAPSTGGAGSTFAQDTSFTNVTSGTHAAISNELTVRSDGSGNIRIALEGSFVPVSGTATANVASKFAYATTSGGSLTDLISEVTGAASIYNTLDSFREDGAIAHSEATFAMPAANTDYYFKALARRITGSVDITFTDANFTVRQ